MERRTDRAHDLVVFGATSFVGQILCRHLAARHGTDGPLRWAIAGRDAAKLDRVAAETGAEVERIVVDATDADGLAEMARRRSPLSMAVGTTVATTTGRNAPRPGARQRLPTTAPQHQLPLTTLGRAAGQQICDSLPYNIADIVPNHASLAGLIAGFSLAGLHPDRRAGRHREHVANQSARHDARGRQAAATLFALAALVRRLSAYQYSAASGDHCPDGRPGVQLRAASSASAVLMVSAFAMLARSVPQLSTTAAAVGCCSTGCRCWSSSAWPPICTRTGSSGPTFETWASGRRVPSSRPGHQVR
ncbi:MAG: saccharopine dehydrogenase NADP-binding domain-containing protein [Acidimicrobiales bacterium]